MNYASLQCKRQVSNEINFVTMRSKYISVCLPTLPHVHKISFWTTNSKLNVIMEVINPSNCQIEWLARKILRGTILVSGWEIGRVGMRVQSWNVLGCPCADSKLKYKFINANVKCR